MMHCQNWEERIALHVGEDLPAHDAAEVQKHLAGCAACRLFWSGMKESLDLLRAAHAEQADPGVDPGVDPWVAPAYATAVRARVMAHLEAGRTPWWHRRLVIALAAAVVVLVLVLANWPGRQRQMPPVRMLAAVPPAPAKASRGLRPRPARGLPHVAHVARPWAVKPAQAGNLPRQPLLVRLVTDDPNVIIYWIAD